MEVWFGPDADRLSLGLFNCGSAAPNGGSAVTIEYALQGPGLCDFSLTDTIPGDYLLENLSAGPLSLSVWFSNEVETYSVLGILNGEEIREFDTGPASLSASITYSEPAPVPIPAGVMLLLTTLAGIAGVGRLHDVR